MGFAASDFSSSGEIASFADEGDAGKGIDRSFCPKCGSRLFARPGSAPGFVIVYAGQLDDPEVFAPVIAIHAESRAQWAAEPIGVEVFGGAAPD